MPSQTLSIRRKLLILLAAVILALTLLLATTSYFNNQITQLEQLKHNVQQLNIYSLQLRRNEKDFFLRKDMKYFEKFSNNYQKLTLLINDIEQQNTRINAGIQSEKLAQSFASYQDKFSQLSELMAIKGLNKDSGEYGQLRAATHELEQGFKSQVDLASQVILLTMRRHEKDYMLRNDDSYLIKLTHAITELSLRFTDNSAITQLINNYQNAINTYAAINKQIGLTPTEGVTGEMRAATHNAESILKSSVTRATEHIESKETLATLISFSLFLLISAALATFIFKLINLVLMY